MSPEERRRLIKRRHEARRRAPLTEQERAQIRARAEHEMTHEAALKLAFFRELCAAPFLGPVMPFSAWIRVRVARPATEEGNAAPGAC